MGLILTLILGGLVGWLASKLMNRDAEQGVVGNVLVGIAGAILGSLIANALGQGAAGGDWTINWSFADIFWAFVGAVVVSALWNLATRKKLR